MDVFFLAGFFEKKLFGGFFGMLVEVGNVSDVKIC